MPVAAAASPLVQCAMVARSCWRPCTRNLQAHVWTLELAISRVAACLAVAFQRHPVALSTRLVLGPAMEDHSALMRMLSNV